MLRGWAKAHDDSFLLTGSALAVRRREPVSLLAEPQAVRPSFEALVERLVRNLTRVGIPKAERPEGLTVEVILTPEEAVRGVAVPIGVPGLHRCGLAEALGA